jgi:hypothetical protein
MLGAKASVRMVAGFMRGAGAVEHRGAPRDPGGVAHARYTPVDSYRWTSSQS